MKKILFAVAALALSLDLAHAAPLTARTNTLIVNSGTIGPDGLYQNVRSENWGLVGLAPKALTLTGAGANNVPYIQFHNGSGDTGVEEFYTSTTLTYEWKITGADNTPVLVHINNSGWLDLFYSLDPDQDYYNLYPNIPAALIANTFQTATSSGSDVRRYGIQTGNYNWGVESMIAPNIGNHGGTFTMKGQFDISFDLWVTPNIVNTVSMVAESSLYKNNRFNVDYATEAYNFNGYIDPVITIDSAFASSYALEVADIPVFATDIPEPASTSLAAIALVAFAVSRSRRRKLKF